MADAKSEISWPAVIARSLAFQSMHLAGLNDPKVKLAEKAQFLMTLGLPRAEAAALLGTSDDSLRVTLANAKKKAVASGDVK